MPLFTTKNVKPRLPFGSIEFGHFAAAIFFLLLCPIKRNDQIGIVKE